ncbi:putative inactive receptor kinase [Capsicum annuum]|uniref:Inactive receptor kinase n=1 Tax=Capsicum annuum TaxID=4072 RepID=A0A1U8FQM3_CAPAN|nr:probable inactive receptor kinase At5g67200 [Capsicum annuum]KAF3641683.1 putative inactive receptor kinase [Capsicum annuum]KAF3674751.1 putative inactive receptor kinase [Capsicum annuum]PHT90358.1 putative inactive receptor kinase [Capsicum annuum]
MSPLMLPLFLLLLSYTFHFSSSSASSSASSAPFNSLLPSDAVSLLSFKSKADLDNKLLYTLNERFDYCQWRGVKCVQGRVVRFVLQGVGLRGTFPTNSLTHLDQLRILNLRNNSLSGPIPDLSGLPNLKTLFLDHNFFSGTFPVSVLSLHRLVMLDLSRNNLTGLLPVELTVLDRLNYLRLDSNRFNGAIPPLNQTQLQIFNVSNNNLTGPVPVTPTLKKFDVRSFLLNPSLCGEVVDKPCRSSPFFDSPASAASPPTLYQNAQSEGIVVTPPSRHKHKKVGVVLGFVVGTLILIAAVLCIFAFVKKRREEETEAKETKCTIETITNSATAASGTVDSSPEIKLEKEVIVPQGPKQYLKSGNLIFCSGETELYSLEQLMRASAELLGRGTIGTTYKALMASQLIVSVKRLDACKTSITSAEAFEQHMEEVGMLRHPNLVAVRAYFQAKQERLVIYDYQPNGSLFNLIHGSRSNRAKPLHWTSCLKIAEDVAQGLAYIHQASKLTHGNLKSSNVLLGSDFEACLTDYSLIVLADISSDDDPDSARYKAPEVRKSARRATPGSDVYAYGILLLELLTGKPPSQHPHLSPPDVPDWVRAMREDDNEEDRWLAMLVDLASICSLTSPEQRPTMRQILKMIQDIKDNAMVENNKRDAHTGYS